jgi:hypothetical protein
MTAASSAVPHSSILGEADMRAFALDAKIGLLATLNPEGLPHVSLITSLQARGPQQLMFGQFTEGLSKTHVVQNPRVGFLVMTPQKEVWRGQARWTHAAGSGEDYELYNRKPMFRYNAYFGIHTVHYLDLVAFRGPERLSVPGIAAGSLVAMLWSMLLPTRGSGRVLKPWAERHLSKIGTMKFLCHVSDDGYPVIVPVVPCRSVGSNRLLFAPTVYHRELTAIAVGRTVCVFALNLQMESVLVRGPLRGFHGAGGVRIGRVDIDWVYNSMPPKQGRIYPEQSLRASVVRSGGPHTP